MWHSPSPQPPMQSKMTMPFKPDVSLRLCAIAHAAALLVLASEQVSASGNPDMQTLSVTDFGAIPDDGRDDCPAVLAALERANKSDRPSVLRFPPGRYDFFKETATKASYPVTAVHLQWDLVTPFHLNGLKQLTIEGAGATFVMHGRMTPFVLNACEGVTIRGMTVEHEHPSVYELKAVAKENNTVDYLVAAGDRYVIEGIRLVWINADDQREACGLVQEYDPLRDTTWRSGDPLREALSIVQQGDGLLRVQYAEASKVIESIHVGRSYQFRNGIRNQCGAVIFESRQVAFEDMRVHSWNGLGFVGQFSRDVTIRNVRMEPREGSGRTNAGYSDGIQMMNCRGRLLVEGCRIVGLHDDHINIYGQMMRLVERESQQVFRAVYTSGETEGHRNFHEGDLIGFRNPENLADIGEAEIVKSELLDNKTMRLEIKGNLPEMPSACWVENRTWIPDEVVVRSNYFGRVPTRSILMYLARKAVIENNVFHRIPMSTILMQTPDEHYALQNSVGSLTIRNNVFIECADTLIRSAPQSANLSPQANLYGTLDAEDNVFLMRERQPLMLDVRGFRKARLGRNLVELTSPPAKLAHLSDCGTAELLPQGILGVEAEPFAEMIRVENVKTEGWKIGQK
jgi:hypothetical protein